MSTPTVQPRRSPLELLQDQLAGMADWQESLAKRLLEEDHERNATREQRLDARRRLDALKRAQESLLARADAAVAASMDLLHPPRAVLSHRNEWLRHKLSLALQDGGLEVLGVYGDGAEGLGAAIADQPDLLVVEDRMPSLSGLEVVRAAKRFLPRTVVVAQVQDGDGVADMLDAGASAVFSRRVPPDLIAEQILQHLADRGSKPLLLV